MISKRQKKTIIIGRGKLGQNPRYNSRSRAYTPNQSVVRKKRNLIHTTPQDERKRVIRDQKTPCPEKVGRYKITSNTPNVLECAYGNFSDVVSTPNLTNVIELDSHEAPKGEDIYDGVNDIREKKQSQYWLSIIWFQDLQERHTPALENIGSNQTIKTWSSDNKMNCILTFVNCDDYG